MATILMISPRIDFQNSCSLNSIKANLDHPSGNYAYAAAAAAAAGGGGGGGDAVTSVMWSQRDTRSPAAQRSAVFTKSRRRRCLKSVDRLTHSLIPLLGHWLPARHTDQLTA